MNTKAEKKREHILTSGTAFILENDFNSLTLDAVANHAGISKGGLLYHFPNKDALLKGLSDHIFEQFTNSFNKHAENDPNEKGKWTRALIETSKWDLDNNAKLNIGIMAASMLNPDISEGLSKGYRYMQNKVEQDNLDPVTASIIRLAIDGIYYSEMLDMAPLDENLREKVIEKLIQMTT
ncbi:TetR/AcrR family transcriptional regulator [Virgibacillus sp. AGTR]|uniref:TetR/AcrR family transcriptional regulator n=1 Tax=unclassified Virgibacillus TaxID=2620237 RepID=UPI000EF53566|nr:MULTISPECIES: TetR/AcrR family transcriptional regulator [unclassified Virgibacillus]MCC2248475.1 TetR/AcrR family transcriptional regulator [Virgibacillus sp. AGTR]MDY7043090.1 TetR/AcrR family transcriptional regulator [Virgibacillus sp. M23]QRZ16661.1 TetR family transcriptional regulator [Virgibacillus sp. AGTR]